MHHSEGLRRIGPMQHVYSLMNEHKRLLVTAFLIGSAVAAAEIAYFQYAYSHDLVTPDVLGLLWLCLNPPSLLGVVFIDVKASRVEELVLGSVVILSNGALYAFITKLFLRKRERSA